jgi:hypothetical protein
MTWQSSINTVSGIRLEKNISQLYANALLLVSGVFAYPARLVKD